MARQFEALLLLTLACGCASTARQPHAYEYVPPYVLGWYEYVEKTDQGCTVRCSVDRIRATPAWTNDAPCPPLSPRDALRIAAARLPDFLKDPKEWDLLAIELRQEFSTKRWFYKVNYVKAKEVISFPPQFGVYILMDGSVVEPTPEKK